MRSIDSFSLAVSSHSSRIIMSPHSQRWPNVRKIDDTPNIFHSKKFPPLRPLHLHYSSRGHLTKYSREIHHKWSFTNIPKLQNPFTSWCFNNHVHGSLPIICWTPILVLEIKLVGEWIAKFMRFIWQTPTYQPTKICPASSFIFLLTRNFQLYSVSIDLLSSFVCHYA